MSELVHGYCCPILQAHRWLLHGGPIGIRGRGCANIEVFCDVVRLRRLARSLMQKITPFLWFDNQAEEAMKFYTSIFKNSRIGRVSRYGDAGPGPKGTVMSATFEVEGQQL